MTDWRIINKNTYIDIDSFTELSPDVYQCWMKVKNDDSPQYQKLEQIYNLSIGYSLQEILINCKAYNFSIKDGLFYDTSGKLVFNFQLEYYQLEWTDIPPGSVAEVIYNIIVGNYTPPKINPFIAFIESLIVGFFVTIFLGYIFIPYFWKHPLISTIFFAYLFYPWCKYCYNWGLAYKNIWHFIGRFILAHIVIFGLFNGIINFSNMHLGHELQSSYNNSLKYCSGKNLFPAEFNICVDNYIKNSASSSVYSMYNNIYNKCYNSDLSNAEKSNCVHDNVINFGK